MAHRLTGERVEDITAEAVSVGIACWYAPERWFPAMERRGVRAFLTSMPRGSPASLCRSGPRLGIASDERQPQPGQPVRPRWSPNRAGKASMPASCNWSERPARPSRRCSASPTGTRSGLPRSRSSSALAAWLLSHDSERVLAVLVVATPCPLILAAPVAMIGGSTRRHGTVSSCATERRWNDWAV